MESARFTQKERDFVYGVAMKYMKDEQRADDVAQDALLNAYRHRASFRGDARFTTWLYRIAATTALMHLRKERSQLRTQSLDGDDDGAPELPAAGASPEERCANAEMVRRADVQLRSMGEKYGAIFQLRFVEGHSESEIATRLRMNVATVKTRAYRARSFVTSALAAAA